MKNNDALVERSLIPIPIWEILLHKSKRQIIGLVTLILGFFVFSNAFGQITTIPFTTTGAGTWTAPCGVTSITVEAWGSGGSGGGITANYSKGGGGGAGGTYVSSTLTVIPGNIYNLYVAPGTTGANTAGSKGQGSWFNTNAILFAEGGNGGAAPNNATVLGGLGSIAASFGTTKIAGASGANGTTTTGGAGGDGANGGGAGGIQRTTEDNGANGNAIGGGGGGAFIPDRSDHSGGNGARGEIRITYTNVIPANPGNPTSNSPQCNPAGVTLTRGTPPAGVTWFWQTTALGTSTTNSGATYNVTTSNTYYLRARNDATLCWSVGSGSLAVTITPSITTVAGNPNPTNGATGICYSGSGSISSISWSAAAGATSYDVYFGAGGIPGTPNANVIAPTLTFNTGALLPNTTYYWRIVPKNSCGITTGAPVTWSFTTSAVACYCPSSGGTIADGITGVNFNTINNLGTSVNTGYTDYTTLNTTVFKGFPYDLNVYINTGGNYTNYQSVYFDWNGDGDFTGAGEFYSLGTANNVINGLTSLSPFSITVPTGAFTGSVRMRIQSRYNNATTSSCQTGFDGEVEDYTIIIADPVPCSGTPTGGTAAIAPGTGTPSSNFNVSVTGSSIASGLSYQWQISNDGSTAWADIAAATAVGTTTLTAVPLTSTTRYYRRKITCSNGGADAYSTVVSFTTTATTCNPTSQHPDGLHIKSVAFVGTMADPPVNNTTYAPNGYSDYTALSPIAQQAQGEGVNVLASVGGATFGRGTWKAWVDWSGDGDFDDAGEEVYNIYGFAGAAANIGFSVPVNQTPGNYRMRIRVNNGRTCPITNLCETYGFDFSSCDNFNDTNNNGYGETEDYLIKVVENCAAKITSITSGSECGVTGGKQVILAATSSVPVTEFRWYTSLTGNSYVISPPDGSGMATSYTTDPLIATTVFYVTAYNGNCESTFRTPIVAEVKPTPEISFTPSTLEVCGEASVVAVSATGSKEMVHLVKENFEAGTLGVFSVVNTMDGNSNATKALTRFQNKTSVLIRPMVLPTPEGNVWFPAISSGFGANKFVLATSDSKAPNYPNSPVQSALTLTNSVSAVGLDNLSLKLRMYYSRYWADNNNPAANEEYVAIEVSTDNGSTYPNVITKLISNQGLGSNFLTLTYDLSAYVGQANLKFRIRHYSWAGAGFLPDGIAIDDVEIYGERPLQPSFTWTNNNPIGVYIDSAGTTAYTGGPISIVYFKPSDTELEMYASWNVTATASLANSCNAQGSISIINNTKIWKTAATNWFTTNWLPSGNGASTANKCVIIKTPVTINANANALAKNIKIETASGATGRLTINGSLTVTDGINNTGTVADVMVKSDGNLVQINDVAVNSGDLSARRLHTLTTLRKEYNYMSSPVKDQNMKLVYGGVASNIPFVTVLNEPTNFFINAKASDYLIAGKGFSVKEPIATYTGIPVEGLVFNEAEYKGKPNSGLISLPLSYTPNKGYNLAGNPYPSNIDIVELYNNSTTSLIDPTFRFWDNKVNDIYTQMGGTYQGYSYALFNAVTDTTGFGIAAPGNGTGGPVGTKVPNRVIKVSQAFMVRALGTGAALNFKNSVRKTTSTGTVFFGKTSPYNRYRLQLVKPDGFTVQNGIAYFDAGNQDFGREDTRIPNSQASDALFSYAGDAKVVINGRNTFNTSDVIPLGVRHFEMGTYKIEAVDMEGVFANGQSIYLKDKQLNILTDLTAGSYTFTSNSGEFTNRFEIVYEPGAVLTTESSTKSSFEVYRDAADFVVNSSTKAIDSIELYDASGKLVLTQKGNNRKDLRFNAEKLVEGMYIVKANLKGGEALTKKIRK